MEQNSVLVCGFPKTGNTWIRFICMNYFNILNHGAKETLTYKELSKIQCHRVERDVDEKFEEFRYKPFVFEEGFPPLYHTHVNFYTRYREYFKKFNKIVYLIRNPYDTMISYFHYLRDREVPFNGRHSPEETKRLMDIEYFIRKFFPNYVLHIRKTLPIADLVLDYDECKVKPSKFIKLLRLFDVKLDFEVFIKTLEMSSFNSIRKMGIEKNQKYGLASSYKGHFCRNGKTGQYKSVLSKELLDWMDSMLEQNNLRGIFYECRKL